MKGFLEQDELPYKRIIRYLEGKINRKKIYSRLGLWQNRVNMGYG